MKDLQDIMALARRAPGERAALATLVSVEGSSYRRPGASMLMTADGRRAGGISGGCLERDVERHAREALAAGTPRLVLYDTQSEADLILGTGLGCGGRLEILIEPIALGAELSPVARWATALDRREALAEVIVTAPGASPVPVGWRLFLWSHALDAPSWHRHAEHAEHAEQAGHAGESGAPAAAAIETAHAANAAGEADEEGGDASPLASAAGAPLVASAAGTAEASAQQEQSLPLPGAPPTSSSPTSSASSSSSSSPSFSSSASAAGRMADLVDAATRAAREALVRGGPSAPAVLETLAGPQPVFVRLVAPPVQLIVCGAGDDAMPLVRMAATLGWYVRVVDHRAGFATADRFPEAAHVDVAIAGELPASIRLDARTVAVTMNHNFRADSAWLRGLAPLSLPYIGVLGARTRTQRLLKDAELDTSGGAGLRHIFAPAGLDLGSEGSEQIALAIIAEIQAVLAGRSGSSLRDRPATSRVAAALPA